MKWMDNFRYALLPLFFSLLSPLLAQRSDAWKQAHDHQDRYEGTYSRQVGNPDLELVSLTTGVASYAFGKKAQLKVRFYSPGAMAYQLHAEDLKGTQFYWWEDKHTDASKGWYRSPADWPVDFLLRRLNIRSNNLGVLAQLGTEDAKKFAPVQVYAGEALPEISRYVALLRLGRATAGGEYRVHRGESRTGTLLLKKSITARSGGSILPLSLPADALPAGSWVFVEVNLEERGTLDPFTYSFQLYVPARP